ncbi:MAG: site-specific DNA-methyltransferase [Treponemataceae bacterium]|nr:site-specific DNA-methyltransferase [Treponemataceae bacterium]
MKSERNKTLSVPPEQAADYLGRCIPVPALPAARGAAALSDAVIHGDTFAALPLLPRPFAALAVCDPPYNLAKDFHGGAFRAMPPEEYEAYTESWISLVAPLLLPDASIYVCCDWRSSSAVERALRRHFIVKNRITWQREKGRGARRNWKNAMEDIWFAVKSERYVFHVEDVKCRRRVVAPYRADGMPKDWEETADGKFRNTFPSNFWDDISIPYWSMPENTAHPTQKPEKLVAKLILASSDAGDLVFDPFLGSGTTAVVAKKLGRRFCGIEQNAEYCVWAQRRLELAAADASIQGYAGGVFWERNTAALQKRCRRQESGGGTKNAECMGGAES